MSDFMQPDIVYGYWYEVDGPMCTEWIPADLVPDQYTQNWRSGDTIPGPLADYCENTEANEINLKKGYGARLSAPGYLDCTDWCVFDTEVEAAEYLLEMYDVEI